MTTPERLLEDPNASAEEVALVRLAKSETMSNASRHKILAGVGTSGTLVALQAGVSTAAKRAWPWGKVGLGVGAAGVLAASFALLRSPAPEMRAPTSTPPTAITPLKVGSGVGTTPQEPSVSGTAENPIYPASDLPLAQPAPGTTGAVGATDTKGATGATGATSNPRKAPHAAVKPALAAELAALKAAKVSLADGDAASALKLVNDYRRAFPSGRLGQEASVLEVEALLKLGERDKAERLAEPLLSGQSLYAARLRSLLGE